MAKGKCHEWLTPDGLVVLRAYARDGLTDKQIACKCGISCGTLYEWKKKYSEISEALKKGKEPVDIEVENTLLKRALGYNYTEMTREPVPDPDDASRTILSVTKIVTKHAAPDTTALIFWLRNRKPESWRNNPEATGIKDDREDDNLFDAISKAVKNKDAI